MVYLFGIIGFIGGFVFGLGMINVFLRGYSNDDLVQKKSLRWTYGLFVWLIAALGAWTGVWMHGRYFY